MTGTFPEFNGIVLISKEELSKFSEYDYWMNLKGMWRWVKDFSGCMNRVSDNDDLGNVIVIWGLVDTAPYGKKFSFSAGDVNHVMDSLGDGVIMGVYVQYWYSNVVLDANISDYNGGRRETWCLDDHVVKLMSANFIVLLFAMYIKRSEKLLIILWPQESSGWREVKKRKFSLNLLSISTKWLLMREHWHLVRESSKAGCWDMDALWGKSISDWMRWLGESECAHSCDLLLSFWRWSLIDTRLAMALIPNDSEVLKASKIYMAALLYILPSIFKWYDIGAWL